MLPMILATFLHTTPLLQDNVDTAGKADLKKMQGEWISTKYVDDGKPSAPEDLKLIKLVISDAKSTFSKKGESSTGTYALVPGAKPSQLNIAITSGPLKGKTVQAIYQLTDDTLRIAVAKEGKPRPTNFKEEPGKVVEVWKRAVVAAKVDKPMAQPKPAVPVPPPFEDKALEAAVRAVLHEPTAELNEERLNNVHVLEAPGKKIKSLKGLDKCRNLALLNLAKNEIKDVSALKDLNVLQSLDLSHNQIKDISPITSLNKLQYLELSHNMVERLDAVANLTALNSIYASHNQIADLSPLAKLSKLWTLSLPNNRISDLSALEKLPRLQTIDLSGNQVSDLNPLAKQTELNLLILENNKISDIAPLVRWLETDSKGEKRISPFLRLYLKRNPLSPDSKGSHSKSLRALGVRIESE